VEVSAVDDAPVLSALETTTVQFVESLGAVPVTAALIVQDVDDASLVGATVTLSSGTLQSAEDVLGFTAMHGVTGTFTPGTGVLALTGTATLAQYQDVLRSVTYDNTEQHPTVGARNLEFQVSGASAVSNIAQRALNVTGVRFDVVASLEFDSLTCDALDGNLIQHILELLAVQLNVALSTLSYTGSSCGSISFGVVANDIPTQALADAIRALLAAGFASLGDLGAAFANSVALVANDPASLPAAVSFTPTSSSTGGAAAAGSSSSTGAVAQTQVASDDDSFGDWISDNMLTFILICAGVLAFIIFAIVTVWCCCCRDSYKAHADERRKAQAALDEPHIEDPEAAFGERQHQRAMSPQLLDAAAVRASSPAQAVRNALSPVSASSQQRLNAAQAPRSASPVQYRSVQPVVMMQSPSSQQQQQPLQQYTPSSKAPRSPGHITFNAQTGQASIHDDDRLYHGEDDSAAAAATTAADVFSFDQVDASPAHVSVQMTELAAASPSSQNSSYHQSPSFHHQQQQQQHVVNEEIELPDSFAHFADTL
jgi:hypothetical protein